MFELWSQMKRQRIRQRRDDFMTEIEILLVQKWVVLRAILKKNQNEKNPKKNENVDPDPETKK